MVTKKYQFGHIVIEVNFSEEMPIPSNMKKFECMDQDSKIQKKYYLECTGTLADVENTLRETCPNAKEIRRDSLRVLTDAGVECRIMNFQGASKPYAISLEKEEESTRVWIDEEAVPMMNYDTVFVSLLSLERLMLTQDSLILHSAYMCREGKAILFSAPSETGKSTQADLWEKYRNTRTINGDRSLLVREEDGWYAYGWPVCGSSEICNNEAYPIQAIVMLHQAKTNSVRELKGFEAVQKLMSQITINMWNAKFQMKAMDKIEEIVAEIPMYDLGCDISEEAVKCLEKVL